MDLESKRVWDYAGDAYVHRIIQDAAKPGEKLVELPGRRREPTALEGQEDVEMAKMDNIALEYTHLLTSQLESQRVYFEEVVERAVDKASEANKKAERAMEESRMAMEKLHNLESQHDVVAKGLVPELEKEKSRLEKRSAKFEEMARSFNQKYQEEKTLAVNLLERVKFLEDTRINQLNNTIRHLEEENATKDLLMEGLRDEHRDAIMQISAQKKLQEMVANGELDQEDLDGATIEAGPAKKVPLRRGRRIVNGQGRNVSSSMPAQTPHAGGGDASRYTGGSNEMNALYGEIFGEGLRSKDWDEDKAKKILDECKAKLLGEGLIVPPAAAEAESTDAEVDGEQEIDGQGKSKGTSGASKKRKGKKKAKK
jgi:hypothetical protein